jgi:molecular chaperone GrpE (heat shock protein)
MGFALHPSVMREPMELRMIKWPFFAGDALLFCAAWFICAQGLRPILFSTLILAVLCVAAGAVLSVTPFVLEYRAASRLAEVNALTTVVSQIQNLEALGAQIGSATGQWQDAQQSADKTANAAREIAERMTAEVKNFAEFMERVSDREKATLRLEVEKLHRAENEWLQVLVRMLDHVYALHAGALRSSQPSLIEQVGSFQNACRDAARRVGLTPFTASDAEPFDVQRHQLVEGDSQPAGGATVSETIAAGYTFQGRLLRPALVRIANGNGDRSLSSSSSPASS